MDVVTALHASGAVLLVLAGAAKVARPAPTTDLLVALGLPDRSWLTAGIGSVEIIVGLAALVVGGAVPAAVVGSLYLAFAAVVVRALAVGAPSCGCFGRADAPPSPIHVVGDLAFAAVSFVAIAGRTPIEVMEDQPAGGLPFVLLVGVIAGLALVAFTALPEALGARRPSRRRVFSIDGAPADREST